MKEILHLVNEMSPYLLLGFLIAGLLHVFVPRSFFQRYLAKDSFQSVINAAILGIPLPLCSCGVIPMAMSLYRDGASKGAVTSFLIATPQTGVDSIIATYSLLGVHFAIIRPVAALFTALFGGWMVNLFCHREQEPAGHDSASDDHCCCHHEDKHEEESHCCCHHEDKHEEEGHCCCHHEEKGANSFYKKMRAVFRYAFVEMMIDIGKWLVIGLVVAALITILVPDSFFAVFKDNSFLSMLLVLVISVPMYICATGSIPIAVALMMKGLTPGAALVLLMAGPAANMASVLVIRHRLGTRTLLFYLLSIILGAVAFGLAIDYLMPREWFDLGAMTGNTCCIEEQSIFSWICSVVLFLLIVHAFIISRRNHDCHCSC